jgi:uncharacterized membrane protein
MGLTPSKPRQVFTEEEIQKAHDDLVDFIVSKYNENSHRIAIYINKNNPVIVNYTKICRGDGIIPILKSFNTKCNPRPYVVIGAYQEGIEISFIQNLPPTC